MGLSKYTVRGVSLTVRSYTGGQEIRCVNGIRVFITVLTKARH
jgi:hypothetical protein